MDGHPLAVSAATGSFTSSLLWLLKEWAFDRDWPLPPPDLHGLECPQFPEIQLDFWWGVGIGFLFWPLLELLILLKQWATLHLRARVAGFTTQGGSRLYKVL